MKTSPQLQLAFNIRMTGWPNAVTIYLTVSNSPAARTRRKETLSNQIANGALILGGVHVGTTQPEILNATSTNDIAEKAGYTFMYLTLVACRLTKDSILTVLYAKRPSDDMSNAIDAGAHSTEVEVQ